MVNEYFQQYVGNVVELVAQMDFVGIASHGDICYERGLAKYCKKTKNKLTKVYFAHVANLFVKHNIYGKTPRIAT